MRTVGVVGAVGVVLLGGASILAGNVAGRVVARAENTVSEPGTVPVLSARRTPSVLSASARADRIRDAMTNVESSLPEASCLKVTWLGRTVSSVRAGSVRTPASITKIVTAAVALEVLGADSTFVTRVTGVLEGSVVRGDLHLVGGGDPVLVRRNYPASEQYPTTSPTYLEDLADAVVAAGVRTIEGSVVGDGTRYDAERYPQSWPVEFHKTEAGPVGALVVNDGLVMGESTRGDDPALAAAREFVGLLAARGVSVGGAALSGSAAPDAPEIASISSAPLRAIVGELLTNSDDNTAEMLVKEIGVAASSSGTWTAGLTAVETQMRAWGLPVEGWIQLDGSGLSSGNKISCDAVVTILSRQEAILVGAMAVAGRTGTLADDFVNSAVAGRLAAKTGTLTGVKGLAGYLVVDGNAPVVFSLLMTGNGVEQPGRHVPVWNSLARAMNRAGDVPAAAQLAP
jgi:D-alanyl-D-alanine carboxypeptidase/D-alanyl-D-alanine-endopeptidase (penicillin-binding protein 4)